MTDRNGARDRDGRGDEPSKSLARDRIILEKIAELQARVTALESRAYAVNQQRDAEIQMPKSRSARVSKWLKSLPGRIARKLKMKNR